MIDDNKNSPCVGCMTDLHRIMGRSTLARREKFLQTTGGRREWAAQGQRSTVTP
jgi:hypothetical protein